MSNELWRQPIEALAPQLRSRRISPVDLVDESLARIAAFDGDLQSFVVVSERARAAAEAADRDIAAGNWRGPLHGVPIAVKDNYTTADMPTRAGTDVAALTFPLEDGNCVARLRRAGAIILGKLRMHEFAWGNVTPPCRNPWDLDRVPGGSSGGSGAAVAARLCPAALGSDTGGSIRIPATLCGVVGLKPTYGRIGRSGIVPHSWSLDHAGPLTLTVADAGILLQALAGPDAGDPATSSAAVDDYSGDPSASVAGTRIAVIRNHFFENVSPDVAAAVHAAITFYADRGCEIVEVEVGTLAYGLGAIFAIELASSTAYHDCTLAAGHTALFSPDVRELVEMGRFVTGPDYLKAEQVRTLLMRDFARILSQADVILTPTSPLTAWRSGEWTVDIGGQDESVLAASWRLTYPFNLTGLPAISLPCGFDGAGLPIGLQLAGKPFSEARLLRFARCYEQAHDWWARVPAACAADRARGEHVQ